MGGEAWGVGFVREGGRGGRGGLRSGMVVRRGRQGLDTEGGAGEEGVGAGGGCGGPVLWSGAVFLWVWWGGGTGRVGVDGEAGVGFPIDDGVGCG